MLESKVKAVHPESVEIEWQGKVRHVQNDAIIVCAGGLPPSPFLKSIGITVETKHGTV
jgi:thioredoxin reductase (NADPH)